MKGHEVSQGTYVYDLRKTRRGLDKHIFFKGVLQTANI